MSNNIEDVYQQHILPLSRAEQLRLLARIAENLSQLPERGENTCSIMELHGLGAEIWKGVDAQEYVNELRSEWEHRS